MSNAMLALQFWEGHVVDSCREEADGSLLISLSEVPEIPARCGSCQAPCILVHERNRRRIRERDWFDRRVWLDVPIRRMDCHHCGARVVEHIAWLDRRSRITHRLRGWVEALAQLLPIAHVAQLTGLHWHTIKTIDHQRLKRLHGEFKAEGSRRLVMDEFALHKGHRYATEVIKRSRWLLLRNRSNMQEEQAVKLDELLAANAPLATVYLLKTELKEVWFAPSVREGAQRWKRWYRLALDSKLAPAILFAKRLRKYLRGILASALYPMNSSILEGVNNRIKVIKRMAYGFRDSAYFFLKIKAAFPGKAR